MASRVDLHNHLKQLLGSNNVYYNPPSSVKMKYPAIRYTLSSEDSTYANGNKYSTSRSYEVIVIDFEPDSKIADKILKMPYSKRLTGYTKDDLHHEVITLYY